MYSYQPLFRWSVLGPGRRLGLASVRFLCAPWSPAVRCPGRATCCFWLIARPEPAGDVWWARLRRPPAGPSSWYCPSQGPPPSPRPLCPLSSGDTRETVLKDSVTAAHFSIMNASKSDGLFVELIMLKSELKESMWRSNECRLCIQPYSRCSACTGRTKSYKGLSSLWYIIAVSLLQLCCAGACSFCVIASSVMRMLIRLAGEWHT